MSILSQRLPGAATTALALAIAVPAAAQTVSAPTPGTTDPARPDTAAAQLDSAPRPVAPSAPSRRLPGPSNRPSQTLAAPLSEAYPLEGVGDGVTSGGYNQSRWVEDWSGLRDPKKRKGGLDRLKFLPLADDGEVCVTLSGEFRQRFNVTTNPDLRSAPHQRQDQTRIVGAADLHVGPHFHVFGDLAHAGLGGRNLGNPSGFQKNDLIVQESFADLTGTAGTVALGIRYGRQTFADGPNLLTVPRDNNPIFTTFNGVRGWARRRKRGSTFSTLRRRVPAPKEPTTI